MGKFAKGFFFGSIATVGAVAGSVLAFKKTVVEPIEEKESALEENRKRALRKRRSAHHN